MTKPRWILIGLALAMVGLLLSAVSTAQGQNPNAVYNPAWQVTASPGSVAAAGTYDFTVSVSGFSVSEVRISVCNTTQANPTNARQQRGYANAFCSGADNLVGTHPLALTQGAGSITLNNVPIPATGATFLANNTSAPEWATFAIVPGATPPTQSATATATASPVAPTQSATATASPTATQPPTATATPAPSTQVDIRVASPTAVPRPGTYDVRLLLNGFTQHRLLIAECDPRVGPATKIEDEGDVALYATFFCQDAIDSPRVVFLPNLVGIDVQVVLFNVDIPEHGVMFWAVQDEPTASAFTSILVDPSLAAPPATATPAPAPPPASATPDPAPPPASATPDPAPPPASATPDPEPGETSTPDPDPSASPDPSPAPEDSPGAVAPAPEDTGVVIVPPGDNPADDTRPDTDLTPAPREEDPIPRGDIIEVGEVVLRDNLIANQETLLNIYRCLYDIDVESVPGGCVDGKPARSRVIPAEFNDVAYEGDRELRDRLIVTQENLLNAYRCLFSVDTHLVPDGCPKP